MLLAGRLKEQQQQQKQMLVSGGQLEGGLVSGGQKQMLVSGGQLEGVEQGSGIFLGMNKGMESSCKSMCKCSPAISSDDCAVWNPVACSLSSL